MNRDGLWSVAVLLLSAHHAYVVVMLLGGQDSLCIG